MSSSGLLADLEAVMAAGAYGGTRADYLSTADALLLEKDEGAIAKAGPVALKICQGLYGQARSFDALPLSLAVFQRASEAGNTRLIHNSAVVAGLLSSDSADFAGALDFHGRALEIMHAMGDNVGASRSWNNVGSALCGVGRYDLASVGFKYALAGLSGTDGPQFSRYSALANLAQCALYTGEVEKGLDSARLALEELENGRLKFPADPFSELLLRRNLVRLHVAQGDLDAADAQVQVARTLSAQDGGARASIAVATCLASVEIARGHFDIAGTRLETCLATARPILPALRDTLACIVRADEAQGNSARAMVRLNELSEIMHRATTDSARAHVGLSQWRNRIVALAQAPNLGSHGRLRAHKTVASVPSTWPTLIRLAVGNALQIDPTAAHGTRVGALTRLLAQAYGLSPVQSLEIGIAAQVHDIGITADHEGLIGHFGNASDGPGAEEDRSHCDAGWRILCEDDHPRILLAREIAKYHHSWVNGGGYPGGMTCTAIPLHARFCAVADAYDNIVHSVESRSGDTIGDGLARLRALAGTRLDPDLVALFVDTLEDETRNEGIEMETGNGLASFNQLIHSLSRNQRYL
jgi:HD-GYP domain-containing protein (c-di-GMP phosphodiesterase class II)/tetratricopeptide (TPR) repeat protein